MASIVNILSAHVDNPLSPEYIETIREAVTLLVDGLRIALSQATLAFVISLQFEDFKLTMCLKRNIKGVTN